MTKDWDIIKYKNKCYLVHKPCNPIYLTLSHTFWIATCSFFKIPNIWRCKECGKSAPEEIALAANICFCNENRRLIYHKNLNNFQLK